MTRGRTCAPLHKCSHYARTRAARHGACLGRRAMLLQCQVCAAPVIRIRRTRLEKLFYSHVFICTACATPMRRLRRLLDVRRSFVFSRYTRCVCCGTPKVHRLSKHDPVEAMSHSLLSVLMHCTGAPLRYCPNCRVQYYDWRRLRHGVQA